MGPADDDSAAHGPPGAITALPSWLLNTAGRRATELVTAELAHGGMRRQHYSVLRSLADQGQASQAELGRRLWIDRSDLHALVVELEADRLIERIRDGHDRRRNLVAITPIGRRKLKSLDERVEAAQIALLAPLSDSERQELVRLLTLLVGAAFDAR